MVTTQSGPVDSMAVQRTNATPDGLLYYLREEIPTQEPDFPSTKNPHPELRKSTLTDPFNSIIVQTILNNRTGRIMSSELPVEPKREPRCDNCNAILGLDGMPGEGRWTKITARDAFPYRCKLCLQDPRRPPMAEKFPGAFKDLDKLHQKVFKAHPSSGAICIWNHFARWLNRVMIEQSGRSSIEKSRRGCLSRT
jgi:hypothetical protein